MEKQFVPCFKQSSKYVSHSSMQIWKVSKRKFLDKKVVQQERQL